MASKMIGIPKNATIKALRAAITDASGGKKKFTDPKVEGRVEGLRQALKIIETTDPIAA